MMLNKCFIQILFNNENINMKQTLLSTSPLSDFNYGRVFAVERKNDFSIIMRIVIASSFLLAVAVLIF